MFSQSDVKELPPDKGVEFKLNSLSGKVLMRAQMNLLKT